MNYEEMFKQYFWRLLEQCNGLDEKRICRMYLEKVKEEIRTKKEIYDNINFMSLLPGLLKRVQKNRDCLLILATSFEMIKDANPTKQQNVNFFELLSFIYQKIAKYPEFDLGISAIEKGRLR